MYGVVSLQEKEREEKEGLELDPDRAGYKKDISLLVHTHSN